MTDRYTLHHGDCLDVMRTMPDASVDAIVTDPPYELGFMGKSWDASGIAFNADVWREALRVLKPGGHLLAFSGSRTYHRMAVAIEDAGFEVRDQIMWIYGSGFPKSLDVSKAIDKAAGAEREVIGTKKAVPGVAFNSEGPSELDITAPATPAARQWSGWGTALKPAHEPIVLARKPLIGTVAANVLAHGTGALNIDGTRVAGVMDGVWGTSNRTVDHEGRMFNGSKNGDYRSQQHPAGRWPANVIHDGSDEAVEHFGDAHRFFYCAKASKRDRNEGLDGFEERTAGEVTDRQDGSAGLNSPRAGAGRTSGAKNHHPTVKPTDLMRYLVRLVTPPQGVVLDPFMGSGSTGKAAMYEGNRFIGIEQDADYLAIAEARIKFAIATPEHEVIFPATADITDGEIEGLANPTLFGEAEASA